MNENTKPFLDNFMNDYRAVFGKDQSDKNILLFISFYSKKTAWTGVLAVLWLLSQQRMSSDPVVITNTPTHLEIAKLLGIARESVSIQMLEARKRGLIDYSRRGIVVKDSNKLFNAIFGE